MDPTTSLARLTGRDLEFLASATGGRPADAASLRADPARVEKMIGSGEVYDALFAPWSEHAFSLASPFLVFAVLVAATVRELDTTTFVREWVGPRQRLPVFDVPALRAFVEEPPRRVFLADVLASYTHVASGAVWVRDRRGWSRRRYSELDPVRLAGLLDVVPESQQAAVHKRLGDLALFLTGVFPDAADRFFRPVQVERLERLLGEVTGPPDETAGDPPGAVGLLQRLGTRSYRAVARMMHGQAVDAARTATEAADRFGDARRVLNLVTDRHLFPVRDQWFPAG